MDAQYLLQNWYKGNLQWLLGHTIFLAKHGSHAYGTNTFMSDVDIKGIAIPPLNYLHGFVNNFEQAEFKEPADMVIYGIQKFFKLAADCNPNIIEILFTEDYIMTSKYWEMVQAKRDLFLSKNARYRFAGYAMAQLKRINTHRKWLLSPPIAPPTRSEYGLPETTVIAHDQLEAAMAAIRKKLSGWQVDLEVLDDATRVNLLNNMAEWLEEMQLNSDAQFMAAGRCIGYSENFLLLLDRERAYLNRHREWKQYQTWKKGRNPIRHELEVKYGFDTKHACHLVRLIRMCEEILSTGQVYVKRPDAEELLAIRNGAWTYEKLMEWTGDIDARLDKLMVTSKLPTRPDRVALDALCCNVIEQFHDIE